MWTTLALAVSGWAIAWALHLEVSLSPGTGSEAELLVSFHTASSSCSLRLEAAVRVNCSVLELPNFPVATCLQEQQGFELSFSSCLVKNTTYHLVLGLEDVALGFVRLTTALEEATAQLQLEARAFAAAGVLRLEHVPQYMDPVAMERQLVSMVVRLTRHQSDPKGDSLLLIPSPLTLWSPLRQPGRACTALALNGSALPCTETAWGFLVTSTADFELHTRLPRGGATGARPWRGLLGGAVFTAPVAMGPWPRSAVRSATSAQRGRVQLDLDVGVDLCILDPMQWLPAVVRLMPPATLLLPPRSAVPEEGNAAPVDCLSEGTGCSMTLVPEQWQRGLPCLFRGVIYSLQWETTTVAVVTRSSGWSVEVEYPVPLDGSLNSSRWISSATALPTSFGSLPFLALQPLRPLGGLREREALLLLRFQTGRSGAYQDLRLGWRPSKIVLTWEGAFHSCSDLVLEMRGLPLLSTCQASAEEGIVELTFQDALQSEVSYDLVLRTSPTSSALTLEVRGERSLAEWGEVPSPEFWDGEAVFDELGPVLPEMEAFSEDVVGLVDWKQELLVTSASHLELLEVDLLGGPRSRWQGRCDVASCVPGSLAAWDVDLLLCDGTRLLWLELKNETLRLRGRFGSALAQLGSRGLGSCAALAAAGAAAGGFAFVVDETNHRVLQLKAAGPAAALPSVVLPGADQLALKGPPGPSLQVIYGYDERELLLGQQGQGPLPARLWRVRLADMELLGFVFIQLSSFTDPNQIALLQMDELTALSVGSSWVWAAGEPRLLMRLDKVTLRATEYLSLLPAWGRVEVVTEYNNVVVLGTSSPLVVQVTVVSNLAAASVEVSALQGVPRVATSARALSGESVAVLGSASELVLLPSQQRLSSANGVTAVAPLDAGRVAVATGGGTLQLLHVACATNASQEDSDNITEDCEEASLSPAWQLAGEITSMALEGSTLHVALAEGPEPRATTLQFLLSQGPEGPEGPEGLQGLELQENASTWELGHMSLLPGLDALRLLLVTPSTSRLSILTMDDPYAVGFSVVSIFGLRLAGPLDVGYAATANTDGLNAPRGAAYAAWPAPCLYVADAGNHRVVQLAVSTTMTYQTHFGESGFSGSDPSRLDTPSAVCVGDGFRVYVMDAGNQRLIVLATGETLGRLSLVQSFASPAGHAMVLQPGAGLGVASLWVAAPGRLLRWRLAAPATWELRLHQAHPEAVTPLELDVALTESELTLGVRGGLLIMATPTAWQLPPGLRLGVPPLCQAEVELDGLRKVDCEFLGGPGLPSLSVLIKLEQLTSQLTRIFLRVQLPRGAAPNWLEPGGAWSVALLQGFQGGGWRSRLLPPPAVPALAVPVTPSLTRPVVVAPAQGDARLGSDFTVEALLRPGALLVGSDRLPGQLSLHLPEGFGLVSAEGCEAGAGSCRVALQNGRRLQTALPLRLRLSAPAVLQNTAWELRLESAGPLKVVGLAETRGVRFTYGRLIPSTWSHFPTLLATPVLGPALLRCSFRPYTERTSVVLLVGPETTVLSCRRLALQPAMHVACAAALRSVQLTAEAFSSSVSYHVELEVQHLLGSWMPEESVEEVMLRPSGNSTGPWWRISFEDLQGEALATARWIPGYPVWPQTFDLRLEFVSEAMSPLPPGAWVQLEVTISQLEALGTAPVLRLYAPEGFSFRCDGVTELQSSGLAPPVPVQSSCRGSSALQLDASQALEPDANYSFRSVVRLSMGGFGDWYATIEAGPIKLGTVTGQRLVAADEQEVVEESEELDSDVAVTTTSPGQAQMSRLHVDRLVVTEATRPSATQWLLAQSWAPLEELLSLELLGVRAESFRIGGVLSAGGQLRLRAPQGYSFQEPFDATSVSGPEVQGQSSGSVLELYFPGDVDSDSLDLAVAVRARAGEPEPWRLEIWSALGELLGAEDVGSFDLSRPLRRLLLASERRPPGDLLEISVFLAMPAEGVEGAARLVLSAPALVAFSACEQPEQLRNVPSAGSLQDEIVSAASVQPLPDPSCSAGANVLTVRSRALRAEAVYGFAWPARHLVGRQAPWAPLETGAAELVLANEAASSEEGAWSLAVFAGLRRVAASQAHRVELGLRELRPVWLLPSRPYVGQESLLLVIFALGGRSFPPASLRVALRGGGGAGGATRLRDCERQRSLLRRQQWRNPLDLDQVPEQLEQISTSALPLSGQLTLVQFEDCRGGPQNASLPGESELTLRLNTWLTPPGEQYVLQLVVTHGSERVTAGLSLEVLEGERVLARAADLRGYALAEEMSLTRWSYSSALRSASNALDVEFQPRFRERGPEMLGFFLVAPPSYVFASSSCEELVLERSELLRNLETGRMESKPLFLKEMPLCEVITSHWLFEGGYYQHQLTLLLPPLVGFRPQIRYRVKVSIRNPPLAPDDARMALLQSSPKFSPSPVLVPSLNVWRLVTFRWASGDGGTGEVPFSLAMGPLGRQGGIEKLDEVSWKGFEVT